MTHDAAASCAYAFTMGLRGLTLVWRGTAVVLVGALSLVGCSSAGSDESSLSAPTTPNEPRRTTAAPAEPAGPTRTAAPARAPTPPLPPRYQPSSSELDGAAKRVAARAVEALPKVRHVTYTQYFGYLPPVASILVEADFARGGTTYDVLISQAAGRWRTDSIAPAAPLPPVDDPGSLARQVLDSDQIDLPRAGRVDVASGRVADTVLRSMLAVSEGHRIGISVLISAHPVQVFGTDRRSNHPDGLAYDIGRIDGRLVVEPRTAPLVLEVMRTAAATGAYQVGGPEDLDAGGNQYFSDPTHSDHVHVGFSG